MDYSMSDSMSDIIDPLDEVLLPMDIHIGVMTFREGTTLRNFVREMQAWRLRTQTEAMFHTNLEEVNHTAPALSVTKNAIRRSGCSAYEEGIDCDPPSFLDAEEQREWAIGWISGLKRVWMVP